HTQIKAIKANKPVGGKTTCGAVRRLQQGLCQTVKFIRMTMYPKERGRTAGRACISFLGTNTAIKPVYSLQCHLDVWHVGASAKNALHCKVMRINARIRLCVHVVLSWC